MWESGPGNRQGCWRLPAVHSVHAAGAVSAGAELVAAGRGAAQLLKWVSTAPAHGSWPLTHTLRQSCPGQGW